MSHAGSSFEALGQMDRKTGVFLSKEHAGRRLSPIYLERGKVSEEVHVTARVVRMARRQKGKIDYARG